MSVALFWDIGLKNLSVCAYNTSTHEILLWDVCDTGVRGKAGLSQIVRQLVNFLRDFVDTPAFKRVLPSVVRNVIENQPKMNPTMRVVSSIVGSFFYMRFNWTPLYYNPAYKLMNVDFGALPTAAPPPTGRRRLRRNSTEFASAYRMRKRASIDETRRILETEYAPTEWLTFFERHRKKDDLADTFLMARVYSRAPPTTLEEQESGDFLDDSSSSSSDDNTAAPEEPTCPLQAVQIPPKLRKYTAGNLGHAKFCIEERLHKEYASGAEFFTTLERIVQTSKCKGILEFREMLQTCSCESKDTCRRELFTRMFPEPHWKIMFTI